MDGTAIFAIAALISLCVVGAIWCITQMAELETMPKRRQVERTVIPADWDRIMVMTTLTRTGEKEEQRK